MYVYLYKSTNNCKAFAFLSLARSSTLLVTLAKQLLRTLSLAHALRGLQEIGNR